MIVIYCQAPPARRATTDGATTILRLRHLFVLVYRNPEESSQIPGPATGLVPLTFFRPAGIQFALILPSSRDAAPTPTPTIEATLCPVNRRCCDSRHQTTTSVQIIDSVGVTLGRMMT